MLADERGTPWRLAMWVCPGDTKSLVCAPGEAWDGLPLGMGDSPCG